MIEKAHRSTNPALSSQDIWLFDNFIIACFSFFKNASHKKLDEENEDLDSTDDGEPGEKTHRAANQTQLSLKLQLLISHNLTIRFIE